MITATYHQHILNFKNPSGTSRGVLRTKETWFLVVRDSHDGAKGIGECGLLRGLSIDDRPDYEQKLQWVCKHIDKGEAFLWNALREFPSIQFGIEQAFRSLTALESFNLFPSDFTTGGDAIPINGLVWMGDPAYMKAQIEQLLAKGFDCIKMKVGAIAFEEELRLLSFIRSHYDASKITLRVDANGGFAFAKAKKVLSQLAELDIHSIEQPIATNQWQEMAELCASTPLPIALDEELIGIADVAKKQEMLHFIRPQYCILKPSFIGGYKGSQEWINIANDLNIGWWVTSALESNVGLNAIAQWTYAIKAKGPQGLGTGSLFTNNISSPLVVKNGTLHINLKQSWDFNYN